jgi:beta propeller repeat protein
VEVNDQAKTPQTTNPSNTGGKTSLIDGIDQNQPTTNPANADAGSTTGPTTSSSDAAAVVDARATTDTASSPRDAFVPSDATAVPDATSSIDTAPPKDLLDTVPITGLQVLADGLTAISVPAVGSDGVSVLQYTTTNTALALRVNWDGVATRWYESSAARYIHLAASGTRHVAVLYLASTYPIQQNGAGTDLSGTPNTYKEFLAANDSGYAWVDYVQGGGGGGRQGGGTSTTSLGAVVFQTWQGARTTLTDSLRYRARVDVSNSHAAYVEYASTTTGTPGQIMVQPVGGGAAAIVAASSHHQDRPAVDGNWLVWEEYLSSTDVVIRAKNLVTGEVRNLSSTVGFRTNPDIRGTRVVWEDQRSGNGDIYTTDLAANKGEQVAVSGAGYSTGARLTSDGLVWIEANGNNIGLLRARWKL